MPLKATNDNVLVVRDKSTSELNGLFIPDEAKKKMHKGEIKTVGTLVSDKTIAFGKVAVFNKSAGFEIDEDGLTYLVLNQRDIIAIV
jgi:chaperonin GroES